MNSALMKKWRSIFAIWFQEGIAYRASGVLWILTDAIPAMIMPMVLMAASQPSGGMAGYSHNQYAQYYLVMVLLTNFVTSHLMWELAWEIKEGNFTVNLLRPVSYFQVTFIRNVTWRSLRLVFFLPIFVLMLIMYWVPLTSATYHVSWEAITAVVLGHLVSFSLVFAISMLALFFQEVQSVFGLYYFPMMFLSGQLFPIYLMPNWLVQLSHYLPFYYTLALPIDLVLGRVTPTQSHPFLLIQIGWVVVHLVLARVLWRAGLKHYTAVGM